MKVLNDFPALPQRSLVMLKNEKALPELVQEMEKAILKAVADR